MAATMAEQPPSCACIGGSRLLQGVEQSWRVSSSSGTLRLTMALMQRRAAGESCLSPTDSYAVLCVSKRGRSVHYYAIQLLEACSCSRRRQLRSQPQGKLQKGMPGSGGGGGGSGGHPWQHMARHRCAQKTPRRTAEGLMGTWSEQQAGHLQSLVEFHSVARWRGSFICKCSAEQLKRIYYQQQHLCLSGGAKRPLPPVNNALHLLTLTVAV